jgi:hypothetical protein
MLAHILVSVWISEDPLTLHLALFPVPIVNKSVCPLLHTLTIKIIFGKVTGVSISIGPSISTLAVLLAVLIPAYVS